MTVLANSSRRRRRTGSPPLLTDYRQHPSDALDLSPAQQRIADRHFHQGQPPDQIASEMGISSANVGEVLQRVRTAARRFGAERNVTRLLYQSCCRKQKR